MENNHKETKNDIEIVEYIERDGQEPLSSYPKTVAFYSGNMATDMCNVLDDVPCPNCGEETFRDEGRVTWCRECGWNALRNIKKTTMKKEPVKPDNASKINIQRLSLVGIGIFIFSLIAPWFWMKLALSCLSLILAAVCLLATIRRFLIPPV